MFVDNPLVPKDFNLIPRQTWGQQEEENLPFEADFSPSIVFSESKDCLLPSKARWNKNTSASEKASGFEGKRLGPNPNCQIQNELNQFRERIPFPEDVILSDDDFDREFSLLTRPAGTREESPNFFNPWVIAGICFFALWIFTR